ncbi:hypothetical protein COCOBI_pt-1930 (chloroplast) [Coccomyxa sp. Obi]|nr:hypothetical protein COCOBI_pt-1930 [Coccomyxa sp. Obi]
MATLQRNAELVRLDSGEGRGVRWDGGSMATPGHRGGRGVGFDGHPRPCIPKGCKRGEVTSPNESRTPIKLDHQADCGAPSPSQRTTDPRGA